MMYYLFHLSQGPHPISTGFNVFQYVSFRAVCAGITAFLLCLVSGSWVIRKLTSLKFGQPIRTAGCSARGDAAHPADVGDLGDPAGGAADRRVARVGHLVKGRPDDHRHF